MVHLPHEPEMCVCAGAFASPMSFSQLSAFYNYVLYWIVLRHVFVQILLSDWNHQWASASGYQHK